MQGYGSRRRSVFVALIGVIAAVLGGCSVLGATDPDRIVIPSTESLSVQSKPSTLSSTSMTRGRDADSSPSKWSFERIIKSAPRVSNSEYQVGASAADDDREDVSGYHFSTPDREVRCSAGNSGGDSLVCTSDAVKGPARAPAKMDPGCRWDRKLAVLTSEGVSEGGCSNRYSVLHRSRVIDPGSAIVVNRFACLSDSSGLYCVESGADAGFALTKRGFNEIKASDRAPRSLTGSDTDSTDSESRSSVAPTR
ncbi:hypothetical protein [Gordonia zhaorongruii]|uniref:hypothetical protein n=1 Tax=Gordonia zhaorongruii TaxID=2597659 RepID=UPI001050995E|nr:hypothetical protein [Gordonia zhaorongruii]